MAYVERIVPDETPPGPVAMHEERYRFAQAFCDDRRTLDAACGVGYGSAMLGERAAYVLGVDRSEEAIDYARARYQRPNVEFRVADLLELDVPDASFDVVCSFETLEHLPDRDVYLGHMSRVLQDDGVFLVSTPHAEETTTHPANPHHEVEYSREDFVALLSGFFGAIELYGQRRLQTRRHRVLQRLDVFGIRKIAFLRRAGSTITGTEPMWNLTAGSIVIDRANIDRASELLAVCRKPVRR